MCLILQLHTVDIYEVAINIMMNYIIITFVLNIKVAVITKMSFVTRYKLLKNSQSRSLIKRSCENIIMLNRYTVQ